MDHTKGSTSALFADTGGNNFLVLEAPACLDDFSGLKPNDGSGSQSQCPLTLVARFDERFVVAHIEVLVKEGNTKTIKTVMPCQHFFDLAEALMVFRGQCRNFVNMIERGYRIHGMRLDGLLTNKIVSGVPQLVGPQRLNSTQLQGCFSRSWSGATHGTK
jgi:hypothetical protein